MPMLRRVTWLCLMPILLVVGGCPRAEKPASPDASTPSPTPALTISADPLTGDPCSSILLAKAQFEYQVDANGRRRPVPGPAKLTIVRHTSDGWRAVQLEDEASNVFHKALPVHLAGWGDGILTIGGTAAVMRFWQWNGTAWTQEVLWTPTFGGRWDRLRDCEVGDVDGDGQDEIVVATHDQGVVAVLAQRNGVWTPREIDRAASTFVHEIELADVDGDGAKEIFATPSHPNRADMKSQPGAIVMYRWDGEQFERRVVDELRDTHAKEILAVDLEGDGHPSLLAAVEAQTEQRDGQMGVVRPVEIRRYFFDGHSAPEVIATLDDVQCRFLSPGDVDHDGRLDVVAAGMKSGVWLLHREADGGWSRQLIDAKSSGYEHATLVCDLDGDGRSEVVVASDVQGELRIYRWAKGAFEREVILPLSADEITFNLAVGRF